MRGKTRSSAYCVWPVTFDRASTLRWGFPMTRRSFRSAPLAPPINTLFAGFSRLAGHPCGSQLHGFEYLEVAGAAANVSGESLLDLFAGRLRGFVQQHFCRQEKSRCAISALGSPELSKRLLQRMELRSLCHAFDRDDFMSVQGDPQDQAGEHRTTIHEHGATSAFSQLAAVLGAGKRQVFAKDFQKRLVRGKRHLDPLTIHMEANLRLRRFVLVSFVGRFHWPLRSIQRSRNRTNSTEFQHGDLSNFHYRVLICQ